MEEWDIDRIIKDYVDAAERMKAAGLDGLELQAYGHLMDQFWSPLTNDLDGPYGGSLENRMRFTFDVYAAFAERCGEDFLLGVRYTGDEDLPAASVPAMACRSPTCSRTVGWWTSSTSFADTSIPMPASPT